MIYTTDIYYNFFIKERKSEKNMKWYVLISDFNKKEIIPYNIFNNGKFVDGIKELLEKGIGEYSTFVEDLTKLCRYCFWCKAEYEVMIGDLFEEDVNKYKKVDVFTQIEPNMELLADYILKNNM